MKVTIPTGATIAQHRGARQCQQIAKDLRVVSLDGPTAQKLTARYERIVNKIGFDPIS